VKRLIAPLALALGALLGAALQAAVQLEPIDEAGFDRVLASNRGKVVLFDFWATWCDPCRAELPELVQLDRKWRSRGFVLATVSADLPNAESAALRFLSESRVRFPAYVKHAANDERFIDFIDPKWSGALPALFLYDRTGHHAASFIGESESAEIEKAIEKLL
jgi:thiol-disulfide isomerase/thioredoxin